LRERADRLNARGARLTLVGNGTVEQAKRFHLDQAPDCDVLTDPSLTSYRALGLRRSVAGTLGPRSVAAGIRSTMKGHIQKSVQGDPWQLGGIYVLARGGTTIYSKKFRNAGERPDLTAILKALSEAAQLQERL
jgi:hypothetical protein